MPESLTFIDNFPERLLLLRDKCGWSQRDLASRIEVSRSFIALIEGGKRLPSMATLRRIIEISSEKIGERAAKRILWGHLPAAKADGHDLQ